MQRLSLGPRRTLSPNIKTLKLRNCYLSTLRKVSNCDLWGLPMQHLDHVAIATLICNIGAGGYFLT